MARYARSAGVLLEPVGHLWAAYCPASGETALLNDESAAILEMLAAGAADDADICAALAQDCGVEAVSLVEQVGQCWPNLIQCGLIHEEVGARTIPG